MDYSAMPQHLTDAWSYVSVYASGILVAIFGGLAVALVLFMVVRAMWHD